MAPPRREGVCAVRKATAILLVAVASLAAGCDGTQIRSDEPRETPWWLLIVVGVGLIAVIAVIVARGQRRTEPPPSGPSWKDLGSAGYAQARWLYDVMTEDLAVWRGNVQFDGPSPDTPTASTAKVDDWEALQPRIGEASDSLYALEAVAPDGRSAESARATVATMRTTREAIDSRADARLAYRTADAGGADETTLGESRNREVRASRNLAEARAEFSRALEDLSNLV